MKHNLKHNLKYKIKTSKRRKYCSIVSREATIERNVRTGSSDTREYQYYLSSKHRFHRPFR